MARVRFPVCSPYRLLWALLREHERPVDYVYYAFAQNVWRKTPFYTHLILALLFVLWPLLLLGAWAHLLPRCGFKVKRLTGKGVGRQAVEQLRLAVTQSIAPSRYYIFDLYGDARRARADEHIIRYAFKGGVHNLVNDWLTAQGRSAGKYLLNNKLGFDIHCREHGLASMGSVCGIGRDGTLQWVDYPGPTLPSINLFLKPNQGKGGRGCERWDCIEPGRYRKYGTSEWASAAELLGHVRALGKRRPYLVQPRAKNHPDLIYLCGAALSSMRIMSILNERDEVEVLFAVFKISGHDNSIVDNFHAGGFVSAVDMTTGELGAATDWGIKQPGRWLERHPVTNARIAGRYLPLWPETVELVRRAHASMIDRVAVGWDVAITDRGPALVEGNNQFGLDMVQRTHREPVGNSRFCELYAWHISRALNWRWGLPARPAPGSRSPTLRLAQSSGTA